MKEGGTSSFGAEQSNLSFLGDMLKNIATFSLIVDPGVSVV
jgi:hypothetical protein